MPNIDFSQFASARNMIEQIGATEVILGVMALIGLASLLYGYRLWKAFIFICGFAIGAVIAAMVKESNVLVIIGCGLIAGLLSLVLWYVSLFLLGFAIGAGLLLLAGVTVWPILLIGGILGGILALVIRKFVIIVSTSLSGADMLVFVTFTALKLDDMKLYLVASIVLTIIGIICQYTITSGKKRRQTVQTIEPSASAQPHVESPIPDLPPEA